MKKSKLKSKKKANSKEPKFVTPDFGKFESFTQTHAPLVISQFDDWFHKDMMKKNIDWMIFGKKAVPRKNAIECEFARVDFNNGPTQWGEWPPYSRAYSRKLKAVRYERF